MVRLGYLVLGRRARKWGCLTSGAIDAYRDVRTPRNVLLRPKLAGMINDGGNATAYSASSLLL